MGKARAPEAFGRFFLPGPTEVRPEILQAMVRPMISHRSAEYEALHSRVNRGLQMVFRTERPVYLVTASATAVMEMAVRGAPDGPILSLVNGAFAERFARVAQRCGRRTRVVTVPWGETHALALVEEHLASTPYAAMTVVHSETSTGARADLHSLTELAHRYGVMCLADSVSGVAGLPVETDVWGLDFIFAGSQKALALPPGLAFAVASEAYILQASAAPDRGRYLDPVEFEEFALRDQTPTTPALPLLYAADAQLAAIAAEGIEARWARHAAMRALTEAWVAERRADGMALGVLAREGERSATVSALTLPADRLAADVVRAMAERGFVIGRGYGAMQDSTIRIGHMGDHSPATLGPCLDALASVLSA
ncbi:MAG: aminotransferase class V-fold PLP-dependent enzyme [Gemmatimonadaceae bacterium]